MERPSCIKHWQELQKPDNASYPDSSELLSIGSPLGRFLVCNALAFITNCYHRPPHLLAPCGKD
jgi:hypothetical protein